MFAALALAAAFVFAAPQGPPPACMRGLQEFAWELSSAIEVGDVNRLAALYRWRGTPTRSGYETMTRLQAIVARPLLEVVPVYAEPEPADADADADPDADATALAHPYGTGPLHPGPPAALRLHQTLADGVTPASTTLWLRRDLGCWWVTL
jgi:hypothetical protein